MESVAPFLLILLPFAIAFLLEAVVLYFFRIRRFGASVGVAFLINILSLGVLYLCSLVLGKLGYKFETLLLPLQVILFLWWISVVADGWLLQLFSQKAEKKEVYFASLLMNTISYLFLYYFIINSH